MINQPVTGEGGDFADINNLVMMHYIADHDVKTEEVSIKDAELYFIKYLLLHCSYESSDKV